MASADFSEADSNVGERERSRRAKERREQRASCIIIIIDKRAASARDFIRLAKLRACNYVTSKRVGMAWLTAFVAWLLHSSVGSFIR